MLGHRSGSPTGAAVGVPPLGATPGVGPAPPLPPQPVALRVELATKRQVSTVSAPRIVKLKRMRAAATLLC